VAQPWDADALAHHQALNTLSDQIDPADNLMARNNWHMWMGKLAIDDMQIRPANTAGAHLDSNLPRPGLPVRQLSPFEWSSELVQHHCLHDVCPSYFEDQLFLRARFRPSN
jgi:hypothetical protein